MDRNERLLVSLQLAVELNKGGSLTADEVVEEAEVFEAYLADEDDVDEAQQAA